MVEMNARRNLSQEVDEIKGRMEAMLEGQLRMEEQLKQLIKALNMKKANDAYNGARCNIPHFLKRSIIGTLNYSP